MIHQINWVEINDGSYGTCSTGSQIKFKTSMIRSSLCDYSDAYKLAKGALTHTNTAAEGAAPNNRSKKVIFKNCAPFTEINNKEVHHPKDIDVVMPMYNVIEYSDNYSKTLRRSWKYYVDEPFIDNNGSIIDVPDVLIVLHLIINKK